MRRLFLLRRFKLQSFFRKSIQSELFLEILAPNTSQFVFYGVAVLKKCFAVLPICRKSANGGVPFSKVAGEKPVALLKKDIVMGVFSGIS